MAVGFVRFKSFDSGSSGNSIASGAVTAPSAANCFIVFTIYNRAAGALNTTYVRAGDPDGSRDGGWYDSGTGYGMEVGHFSTIAADTDQVTVNFDVGGTPTAADFNRGIIVMEVSGAHNPAPVVGIAGRHLGFWNTGTDTVATDTGTATATSAPGLKLAFAIDFVGNNLSAGTGFTMPAGGNFMGFSFGTLGVLEHAAYASGAAQVGATWNSSSTGDYGETLVAFVREAAAAAVARNNLLTLGVS